MREPVSHAGRIQLALELPDRCVSLDFECDAAMKAAASGELLGMKERCLLDERKHIPSRYLEKRLAIQCTILAEGIFEHRSRDERHSQNIFVEMTSLLGIPTGVDVMMYLPERIVGRSHFGTSCIVLAHRIPPNRTGPGGRSGNHDLAQPFAYSSWRRHQTPASLRPLGARSSHWYMPQKPSTPRA